mgnify:CR=1 FL=1
MSNEPNIEPPTQTPEEILVDEGIIDPPEDECTAAGPDHDETGGILAPHYHAAMERLAAELAWNRRVRIEAEQRMNRHRESAKVLKDSLRWVEAETHGSDVQRVATAALVHATALLVG